MFTALKSRLDHVTQKISDVLRRVPVLGGFLRWREKHRRGAVAIFVIVAHLLGALTSLQALMGTRTPQGTIAWVVSLNTFPYVAVPAYWIFGGSKFEAYIAARRDDEASIAQEKEHVLEQFRKRNDNPDAAQERNQFITSLTGLPPTAGNRAELLIDGQATFKSIFEGMRQARDYVLIQFYIIRDEGIGEEFRNNIAACNARGVKVYVLYDDMGCDDLSAKYIKEVKASGAQMLAFNTLTENIGRSQLNFRNHRKAVIIDGVTAWVGGINVGDEYLGRDPEVGPWRDTFIKIEGPVVQAIQLTFREDWHWASKENLALNTSPAASSAAGPLVIASIPSGPADKVETCTLLHLHLLNSAKKRIWIASPYFVPDEQFVSALRLAALRGVEIKIIVPDKSDGKLVDLSGWSFVTDLGKSNVQFYRYTHGFMHQKVMLIDDDTSTVGTANFDNRSFRLNFEHTIAVFDAGFAGQIKTMLEKDLAHSRLVGLKEPESKGFWWQLSTRAARLLSPVQ